MDKQQRIEEVGKYIEKYYIPGYDDIVVDDEEVKGFFDKITEFLSGKKEREKDSAPAIEAPKRTGKCVGGFCNARVRHYYSEEEKDQSSHE